MLHKNNFDFIRLIAASMVIWGHAYPLLGEPGLPNFFRVSVSTYAVKLFFVLSGYLVVASWINDPNLKRFTLKRALRILPALIVVVCSSALVLGPLVTTMALSDYFDSHIFKAYFENIRFYIHYALPGVFEDNIYPLAVNGSLWSLPAEVAMYILVFLSGLITLAFSGRFFTTVWATLTITGLVLNFMEFSLGAGVFTGVVIYATLATAALEVAPYFLVGGCLYLWRDLVPRSAWAACIALAAGWFLSGTNWPIETLLIFITSYSVIVLGSMSTPVVREFGRFGDISYGVYLYGFPVAQTLSHFFGRDLSFAAHIFWAMLISYVFAFLSWHLVEKRALRLKPKPRQQQQTREQIASDL